MLQVFVKILILFFPILIFSNENLNFSDVKYFYKKSDIKILDRNGNLLNEVRVNQKFRTTDWLALDEISSHISKALILAEDKNFYEHSGVDYFALLKGFVSYISFQNKRGASTISMQLVSFLNKDLASKKNGRSFKQKWNQIFEAIELEKSWTKNEILEAYLNLAPFKGELIGIDAASRAIFKKEAHALDKMESSILVSFFKSPSGDEKRIQKRACYIFQRMDETDCQEINLTVEKVFLTKTGIKAKKNFAHHLRNKLNLQDLDSIKTSLDLDYQIKAEEIIKNQQKILKPKNANDISLILLENETGEVLAYVGSIDKEIDGAVASRQAGSTLKPFIYAKAIEENLISDNTILLDKPTDIFVGTGIYSPSNYKDKFFGEVTARQALASSLNIPAVKVYKMLNEGKFISLLENLGFEVTEDEDFYGPSIALGSIDINLKDLTNAYRVLANDGIYSEVSFEKINKDKKKIFEKKTTEIISSILSDKEARALTFGLENPLVTKFRTSVKTGTSKDMRDNWCIGYNDKYTLGVWVGNFTGEPMRDVSGVTGAAPIWRVMMNFISTKDTEKKISIPDEKIDSLEQKFTVKIISPINETIFAIDPEIPEEVSAIFFETSIKTKDNYFEIDGNFFSDTSKIRYWKPKKGKHVLTVLKEKKILDTVSFEVR